MADETVLAETAARVLTVTLNRPHVYNAINSEMSRELQEVLRGASRNDEVRAIVITGAGKAFCSGQDLKECEVVADDQPRLGDLLRQQYNDLILQLRRIEKPIIASVNGVAAGAGMSLAMACDLRFASDQASFVQAFVSVGLVPDSGSLYFLPRLVGLAKAFELCMLGEQVSADEALKLGLVNRVVPGDELATATANLAQKLAAGPGKAIGLIKRGLNRGHHAELDDMLEYEAMLQEIAGGTGDFREGVMAFKEKRPPSFVGA